MIAFPSLLAEELRRCLSRRAVHVLVGVALLGIAVAGVVAFVTIDPRDAASTANTNLARLADLWVDGGDATLAPPFILLAIGALIGGALVTGGECKAGTVVTLSTWEVRRVRLLGARLLACAVLAPAIALALAVVFVVAITPTIAVKGTTAGVDAAWAVTLAAGVGRALVLVSLTAVLGAAIASISRSATAALGVVFVDNVVVEPVVRAVWPGRAQWLLGENIAAWFSGQPIEGAGFERGTAAAGVLLAVYVAVVAGAALLAFSRRDLPVAG